VAFLISVLAPSLKAANSIAYGFVLFSIVIELFLTSPSTMKLVYNSLRPNWLPVVIFFLSLYPPFTYSLIFANIVLKSGYHFDSEQRQFVIGPGYHWSDLTQPLSGKITPKMSYEIPSALHNLGVLTGSIVFYAILSWYFDHIVKENRGRSLPPYFLFTRSYWYGSRAAAATTNNNTT
jgi:hypothetical protein